ncbi:MAG TPA: GNAT family N-acetyltransferase [Candidatus Eremiobacteraceae bacterium]|nr:GNAT family N-acetyltransferase [Candidatus Eremiobacteraceae bacterium]
MEIRAARPDDALGVAQVHVRSWQAAYKGLLPAEYLDSLRAEERAVRYDFAPADQMAPFTLVAVDGGLIRAFATVGASPDSPARETGELMALYVDPDDWRTGIGRVLIDRARGELRRRGFADAVLWVLDGNAHAEAFYEHDGWIRSGSRRRQRVWGIEVDEIAYTRRLDDR